MSDAVDALILDLLEYVACKERGYDEVIEAWRTSCPKLPVWEEANERGLISQVRVNGHAVVRITETGVARLKQRRRNDARCGEGDDGTAFDLRQSAAGGVEGRINRPLTPTLSPFGGEGD